MTNTPTRRPMALVSRVPTLEGALKLQGLLLKLIGAVSGECCGSRDPIYGGLCRLGARLPWSPDHASPQNWRGKPTPK
jgi:hypothetical protein